MSEGLEYESESTFYTAIDAGQALSSAIMAVCGRSVAADIIATAAREFIDAYIRAHPRTTRAIRVKKANGTFREMDEVLFWQFAREYCASIRKFRVSADQLKRILELL